MAIGSNVVLEGEYSITELEEGAEVGVVFKRTLPTVNGAFEELVCVNVMKIYLLDPES